jgi:hypothetical protein
MIKILSKLFVTRKRTERIFVFLIAVNFNFVVFLCKTYIYRTSTVNNGKKIITLN